MPSAVPMRQIKNPNAVLTGAFLVLVALLALYLSWPLSSGTDVGLGPGFVPKMFALIQFGIGGLLIGMGFVHQGEAAEAWHPRPLFFILASIAFFAMTIDRMGLIVALTGLVLISCLANRGTTLREALALAAGSAVVSVLLFVKALGLSIPIWPPFAWGT
jgi:putative tricarboxylic transport membrane protein